MEKDEKKSDVVEEKNSEATEEIATPTPYKHPSRSLLEKEDEKTATEESKEESVPASTLKTAVSTTENVSDAFDDLFNS